MPLNPVSTNFSLLGLNSRAPQGAATSSSGDNGMCIYEFSVPLQDTALGNYTLGAGVGTGQNLTVTAGPGAEIRQAMHEVRSQGPREGFGDFGEKEGHSTVFRASVNDLSASRACMSRIPGLAGGETSGRSVIIRRGRVIGE